MKKSIRFLQLYRCIYAIKFKNVLLEYPRLGRGRDFVGREDPVTSDSTINPH